jgi:predicted CopG family antitoxin
MADYKTLRVPEDAYEAAKASKQETETWGEFLRRCSENPPETVEYVKANALEELLQEQTDE